jgi:branched-chain amino acid transport system permease protein
MSQRLTVSLGDWSYTFESVTLYYYLILFFVVLTVVVAYRLQDSRIGRAWMAIREDEIAAKAMGINTRNLKLAAFGTSATFGGIAGVLFASLMRGVYPESFILMESVMIVAMVVLGGLGHIPGVILGALLLAGLPELLRHMAGAAAPSDRRAARARNPASAAHRAGHDHRHAVAPARPCGPRPSMASR